MDHLPFLPLKIEPGEGAAIALEQLKYFSDRGGDHRLGIEGIADLTGEPFIEHVRLLLMKRHLLLGLLQILRRLLLLLTGL